MVDQALSSLFVEHDPFLRNFLAKWPGVRAADSFPKHPTATGCTPMSAAGT